jgi:predicted aspartyl protease
MPKIPHGKRQKVAAWIGENLPPELVTSTLFRFRVRLQAADGIDPETQKPKRRIIEVDTLPDLDIDYEILEEQMADLPAQYAFWSAVYSEVRLGVAVAERKLKARKAQVTKLVSDEFRKETGKTPAAEVLRVVIEADERLNEAEMNFQHAQMQSGKLYHMLEALKMKAELSRSLLGVKKQERDNS